MTSKQIKLLLKILGCTTFIIIAGKLFAAYFRITNQHGIDAPFEDFGFSHAKIEILYYLNKIVRMLH
jgi:hypothetical protein